MQSSGTGSIPNGAEKTASCGDKARHAEYAPIPQTLSIKVAWGGAETYCIDNRVVSVDDENFLILNHERTYEQPAAHYARRSGPSVSGDREQARLKRLRNVRMQRWPARASDDSSSADVLSFARKQTECDLKVWQRTTPVRICPTIR